MPARKSAPAAPAIVVPVLPVATGYAYTAEAIAPVITLWLQSHGVMRIVSGLDVRNMVRGRRKGIASPVPRLLTRPAFGNRSHVYTLSESADVFAAWARLSGQPDMPLPAPFAPTRTRPVTARKAPVKRVAAVKVAPVVSDVTAAE